MVIKLTKEEENIIKILRLVSKVSEKHGEGYYSVDITTSKKGRHFYLPKRGHCEYEDSTKTIKALRNLLKMETVEYKYDLNEMLKRKATLTKEVKSKQEELKIISKGYQDALKKLEGIK